MTAPEHIWEVSFLMPNGDTRWFRTPCTTFGAAVMRAIRASYNDRYYGGDLLSIENVDRP